MNYRKLVIVISSTTGKIKMLMAKSGLNQTELARKLGIKQSTLSEKFTLDNWRESDLRRIAEICGCEYEGYFKNGDWMI